MTILTVLFILILAPFSVQHLYLAAVKFWIFINGTLANFYFGGSMM